MVSVRITDKTMIVPDLTRCHTWGHCCCRQNMAE